MKNLERRRWHACRARIEELLADGWSITGREPLRLELGRRVLLVKGGCVING